MDKTPHTDDSKAALTLYLEAAQPAGAEFVDVTAPELHVLTGGHPGATANRMPRNCSAMRQAMRPGDVVLAAPPSGQDASLAIRYHLPREPLISREGHTSPNDSARYPTARPE